MGLLKKNEKSGSLPDDNRGRFVKRVLSHCKVEEIWVMDLEIFHVFYPFNDKLAVYTLDISSEMAFIRLGAMRTGRPVLSSLLSDD